MYEKLEPYITSDGRVIEVAGYAKCPTCDYPWDAPLTPEGICLNCYLTKEDGY